LRLRLPFEKDRQSQSRIAQPTVTADMDESASGFDRASQWLIGGEVCMYIVDTT
jgi:hypothetical protein